VHKREQPHAQHRAALFFDGPPLAACLNGGWTRVKKVGTTIAVLAPPTLSSLECPKHLDGREPPQVLRNPTPPRDEFCLQPLRPEEAIFRHSGWRLTRQRVYESLCRLHVGGTRLEKFCHCGGAAYVEISPSAGTVRLTANYCRDRCCVPCGAARSAQVTRSLVREAAGKTVRFLTLTLRHSRTPLTDQISRIYRDFSALRRRSWWKDRCTGGAAVLELKIAPDGLWHVHLHCLVLGSFMDQRELSRQWHAVTGDSWIVDIRKVHNEEAIRYVASYTGKPLDSSIYASPDRLDEFIAAIKGRRLVNTWGCWSRIDIDAPDPEAPTDWVAVGRLVDLINDAERGDKWAIRLLDALSITPPNRAPDSS
jgi:hypothetical protein